MKPPMTLPTILIESVGGGRVGQRRVRGGCMECREVGRWSRVGQEARCSAAPAPCLCALRPAGHCRRQRHSTGSRGAPAPQHPQPPFRRTRGGVWVHGRGDGPGGQAVCGAAAEVEVVGRQRALRGHLQRHLVVEAAGGGGWVVEAGARARPARRRHARLLSMRGGTRDPDVPGQHRAHRAAQGLHPPQGLTWGRQTYP